MTGGINGSWCAIPRPSAAEAVTRAVRLAQDLDFSNVATKTDIAELELRLIKWVIGVGISAALAVGAMILTATQIVLRALPHV